MFNQRTLGLVTNRDAWCYNSSVERKLRANIQRSVAFYNAQVAAFQRTNPTGKLADRTKAAKAFATKDERAVPLGREHIYAHLASGRTYTVDDAGFTVSAYRPFFKQRLYFNRETE